jgi:4'-phosphopantetheinyl transferase EntD
MILQAPREDLDCAPLRAALAADDVLIEVRRIRRGDEEAFTETPAGASSLSRRRASGAARIAARRLLGELGADGSSLLARLPTGAPLWPEGIVGSLAHDDIFAVAAAARRGRLIGLGIDVEPAEPLPTDLIDLVLNEAEQRETFGDPIARRLVFACKEAVYKAIHPLDGSPLEYADIAVRLAEGTAVLIDGRRLRLATFIGDRLIAVALAPPRSFRLRLGTAATHGQSTPA